MSLIKVSWYVLRVKNVHFGSPSDTWNPCGNKAELRTLHYQFVRQGEAELRVLKITSVFHHLSSFHPKQLYVLEHLGCTHEVGKYFQVF